MADNISQTHAENHIERSTPVDDAKPHKAIGKVTAVETSRPPSTTDPAHVGKEYATAPKQVLIVLVLSSAVFLMALDSTIITTAIPRISDSFQSIEDVAWYGSAYMLTLSAFQVFWGKLCSLFPPKWIFVGAIGLFEVGSTVCAAAPTSVAFIIGRAVSGVGAAGMMTPGIIILADSVPLSKRPAYLGIVSSMFGIASIMGPLLGGVFTDHVTWRWCFYINLPIGSVSIIISAFFIKSKAPQADAKAYGTTWQKRFWSFDPLGNLLLIVSITCLVLALQWGGAQYSWSNGAVIALLAVSGVLAVSFIMLQLRLGDQATVPVRICKQRTVAASFWYSFCTRGSFMVVVYYTPIWFQAVKDSSAARSGIQLLPLILSVVILSILSGGAVTALGYYAPEYYLGSVLMAVGAGLITTFDANTRPPEWIGYQIVYGAGVGVAIQQPLVAIQTVLDHKDIAIGTGVVTMFQMLGGAVMLGVAQSVFFNHLVHAIEAELPDLNPDILRNVGATSLRDVVPRLQQDFVLRAYNDALVRTWYVATAVAGLSIVGAVFIEWKSVKGKKETTLNLETMESSLSREKVT